MQLCDPIRGFVCHLPILEITSDGEMFSHLSLERHSKFYEMNILCSVKWIFCTVIILSSVQSLIYIILCRCAQAKWFLNELQPRVGPFSSINFDELLSFINCTCFLLPISSITFAFHICVSMMLESAISRVSKFFFSSKVFTSFLWLSSWFPWTGARMFSEPGNSAQWDIERHHSTSIICFDCTSC